MLTFWSGRGLTVTEWLSSSRFGEFMLRGMARYTTTVSSARSPEEAFLFMADFRNVESWDPGVSKVVQAAGEGPGPEAAYDVSASGRVLRYEVREYVPSTRVVFEAETPRVWIRDVVEVSSTSPGSAVLYDATVELKGLWMVANPLLSLAFKRMGDRAAAGLRRALEAVATV